MNDRQSSLQPKEFVGSIVSRHRRRSLRAGIVLSCMLILFLFLMLTITSASAERGNPGSKGQIYRMVNGVRVVEGQKFYEKIDIEGSEWNGAVIRNNVFKWQENTALHVSDVEDLLIENNYFSDMAGFAVKLRSYQQGTRNVVVRGNRFKNLKNTAILVGEPNSNVKILNNTFEEVALDTEGNKKHAIYLQGPDFHVEGNIIKGVGDAHGISVRTSGVVRGNYVERAGEDGVKYFSSSSKKGSGILIIECNVFVNNGHGGIGFAEGKGKKIDRIDVRFNTSVNNGRGVWLYGGLDSIDFYIYGNIFVEENEKFFWLKQEPRIMKDNVNLKAGAGFADAEERDFRLLSSSPAKNMVQTVPGLPPYDFSGNAFAGERYEAGAFQRP